MLPTIVRGRGDREHRGCGAISCHLDWLGEAEVEHLERAVIGDDDVGRLQIPVNDGCSVRARQRECELEAVPQNGAGVEPTAAQEIAERRARDVLHRDVRSAGIGSADVVDGDNVRMVEGGSRLRLAQETPSRFLVV